jgi:hypothetical protein
MTKIAQILILCFTITLQSSLCQSEEKKTDWTTLDTSLEVVYIVAHVGDWAQTRYHQRHPDIWYETNPILGKHPHKDKIDLYMGSTLIAHAAITYFLPKDFKVFGISTYPRNMWQLIWIGIEINQNCENASMGIRYRF